MSPRNKTQNTPPATAEAQGVPAGTSATSSDAGPAGAPHEYQSGAGCMLMTVGLLICVAAILLFTIIFGDFASG